MYIPIGMNIGKMQKLSNGRHALSGDVEIYIFDGKKHREGGPAETNKRTGYRAWFKHGLLHRMGGPAVIDPGHNMEEYWQNGKLIRKEPMC